MRALIILAIILGLFGAGPKKQGGCPRRTINNLMCVAR